MINEQRLQGYFLDLVQIDSEARYERQIAMRLKADLEALGADDTPRVLVLNKVDAVPEEELEALQKRFGGLLVSARTGQGLGPLIALLERRLFLQKAQESLGPEAAR